MASGFVQQGMSDRNLPKNKIEFMEGIYEFYLYRNFSPVSILSSQDFQNLNNKGILVFDTNNTKYKSRTIRKEDLFSEDDLMFPRREDRSVNP